ncbi:MAG: DNA methyltransferase [Gemmatales bacterium]
MVHLTEKPVELATRAIEYSSRAGENVLDLFGGSGSTLIAAEQTGRNAYLMEIDPLYCDVIIHAGSSSPARKQSDLRPNSPHPSVHVGSSGEMSALRGPPLGHLHRP